MLFMNRAVPMDFSYVRSDSSGTSMPPGPADKACSEKFCPMTAICSSDARAVRADVAEKRRAGSAGENEGSKRCSHRKEKKLERMSLIAEL